ncbi:MAG: hypothetical protein QOK11_1632, partial [Pseudonocardiales bacterium]|nr:hypothetical protein [Pseudonocardiales bacterium]
MVAGRRISRTRLSAAADDDALLPAAAY